MLIPTHLQLKAHLLCVVELNRKGHNLCLFKVLAKTLQIAQNGLAFLRVHARNGIDQIVGVEPIVATTLAMKTPTGYGDRLV